MVAATAEYFSQPSYSDHMETCLYTDLVTCVNSHLSLQQTLLIAFFFLFFILDQFSKHLISRDFVSNKILFESPKELIKTCDEIHKPKSNFRRKFCNDSRDVFMQNLTSKISVGSHYWYLNFRRTNLEFSFYFVCISANDDNVKKMRITYPGTFGLKGISF